MGKKLYQRNLYLRYAKEATDPRYRLFYRLMADIAPIVTDMAVKNVNQHGPQVIYEVVLRAAAAMAVEIEANLCRGATDVDLLADNFKLMIDDCINSQQFLGMVPVRPKMDG